MLVGVIASNVLRVLDPSDSRAVGVLFVGYFFQGVGFFMTMFYICIYILRYGFVLARCSFTCTD